MKTEYQVVTGATHNFELFQSDVQSYLNEGWKLSGGVAINASKNTTSAKLYQAMYRELEEHSLNNTPASGAESGRS